MSRYIAGLILAGSNVIYLMGSMWLIIVWKTHVVNPRFFIGGAVIFLVIAVLMAFAFLIGVITSSTAVSIMVTYGFTIFSAILVLHDKFAAAVSKEWQAWVIQSMYWIFPKTAELMQAVVALVGGETLPDKMSNVLSPAPFLTTAAFGVVSLILASWLFTKKEF
jgi:hypothetical protein